MNPNTQLPSPTLTELFPNASYMVFETHVVTSKVDDPHSYDTLIAKLSDRKYIGYQVLDKAANPELGESSLLMVNFFDAEEARAYADSLS